MDAIEREERIHALAAQIQASRDRDVQRVLCRQMTELINGRSPEVVAEMERARGLEG